jgi:multidrug efflux system membrane fusion protein
VDLAAATAALNASKIDLEFTEIRAPIDGLVSRALIKQGELVSNDSLLTTIVANQADREYLRDTARAAL